MTAPDRLTEHAAAELLAGDPLANPIELLRVSFLLAEECRDRPGHAFLCAQLHAVRDQVTGTTHPSRSMLRELAELVRLTHRTLYGVTDENSTPTVQTA